MPELIRSRALLAAATLAIGFGLLAIVSGAIVPFVLWFNFLAGFADVAAGGGLWPGLDWGRWLSLGIAGVTALVFFAFLCLSLRSNPCDLHTLGAMLLRRGVSATFAATAQRIRKT